MPEPLTLSVLSGLASAVSASVTGIKFVFDLKNTPDDVQTCLDLVSRVNKDLQYLISLRTGYAKNLESTPEVLTRVDGVIQDAYESIQAVGVLLEGCRRGAHGGQTPFKGRLQWVLADSAAFQRRTGNLLVQQAAINAEMSNLRNVEALQPVRSLASEISFENLGMIPMGRKRSSSRLSNSDRSDLGSPPAYSPSTDSSLSNYISSSSSSNYSPYTPEPSMSPNSYFSYDPAPVEHNTTDTLNPKFPQQNLSPRIQIQEAYPESEQAIQPEEEDDSAAAFYREMRAKGDQNRRLRGF